MAQDATMKDRMAHSDAFHGLLSSGKYSDVTLTVVETGQSYSAHKSIVCWQSPVLAAAIDGTFKEAQNNVIEITGFDGDTAHRMLEFLYKGDYGTIEGRHADDGVPLVTNTDIAMDGNPESPSHADAITSNDLLAHVRVNIIADYYAIPKLQALTNYKIRIILTSAPKPDEKALCAAMKEALSYSNDREMHKIFGAYAADNIASLIEHADFAHVPGINGLAITMLQKLTKRVKDLELESSERTEGMIMAQWIAQDNATKIANLQSSIALLNRFGTCRNQVCDAEFRAMFEEAASGKHILRCKKCRCKHGTADDPTL